MESEEETQIYGYDKYENFEELSNLNHMTGNLIISGGVGIPGELILCNNLWRRIVIVPFVSNGLTFTNSETINISKSETCTMVACDHCKGKYNEVAMLKHQTKCKKKQLKKTYYVTKNMLY